MKRIMVIVAALVATLGITIPVGNVSAGLSGCSSWYTYTTRNGLPVKTGARADCTSVTPGGFQMFKVKAQCSPSGTYVYGYWSTPAMSYSYVGEDFSCPFGDVSVYNKSIVYGS